jgi:adenylate cyclase
MKKISHVLRSRLGASILVCLFVCSGVILIRNEGLLEFLELEAYDYFVWIRTMDHAPDPRVVLVTISESDIQERQEWPLSDASLADLLKTVNAYDPRVIGVDIYRDMPVPPGRDELAEVLNNSRSMVTIQKIGDEASPGVPPPYVLNNTDLVGFSDSPIDPDDAVRRSLLFLDDGEYVFTSFSLIMALLYLEKEGVVPQQDEHNPEHLRLGETTFVPFESSDGGYIGADAKGYQILLDYKGAYDSFQAFSLSDLMSGRVLPEDVRDKIVLIGVASESVKDMFSTPLSGFPGTNKEMYGVEVHAHAVSQLIRSAVGGDKPVRSIAELHEWYWIVLWGFIGGAAGLWIRSFFRFSFATASCLLILALVAYYSFLSGWWIPLVPPALTILLSSSLVTALMSHKEKVERTLLMHLFSKHVSDEVAEAIWRQRDIIMDKGRPLSQKLVATVLFSDLKGFTSVSERLEPKDLMDWLNEYMESMTRIVIENGGVVSKYIGDSVMGVFGIPFARTGEEAIQRDAVNAVNCALQMESEIERLNDLWAARDMPTTRMRIGIFTGPLIAGSLGSDQRMEYTVIGDTVNVSSRLESYEGDRFGTGATDRSCRILIGEETLKRLDGRFRTQNIGELYLKGKDKKITVYTVTGRTD